MQSIQLRIEQLDRDFQSRIKQETDALEALFRQAETAMAKTAAKSIGGMVRGVAVRWALAVLSAVATLIAGGAVFVTQTPSGQVDVVQETVEAQGEQLGEQVEQYQHRVEAVERKVDKLETIAVDQQGQMVEGFEHLGRKLDAISPKAARVPEPPSMKGARERRDRDRVRRGLGLAEDAPAPK